MLSFLIFQWFPGPGGTVMEGCLHAWYPRFGCDCEWEPHGMPLEFAIDKVVLSGLCIHDLGRYCTSFLFNALGQKSHADSG